MTWSIRSISAHRRELIEPLIEDLLDQFPDIGWRTRLSNRGFYARFIDWCLDQGEELKVDKLFTPELIDAYLTEACETYSEGTRRTIEFTLKRVIKVRGIAEVNIQVPLPEGVSASRSNPYSAEDIVHILDWVAGETSPYMRESRALMVACGLGAGISATEMDVLTWDQVDDSGAGIVLRAVSGRDIPVVDYFAEPFRQFHRHNHDYLFRPHLLDKSKESSRRAIGRSKVCHTTCLKPSTIRMRDTWIEMIVAAGVPVPVAIKGAGLKPTSRYKHLREDASWEAYRFQLHQREPLSAPRLRSV